MSLPKLADAYPRVMIEALERAHRDGEVIIPTDTPLALRLQFQGLRGALRRDQKSEFADQCTFHVSPKGEEPKWFAIRLRVNGPGIADLTKALANLPVSRPSAIDEAEESLNRILGATQ